ncbi:unnamed protein product [Linum trigynum]|uniref:Uncharacterized protein n=1 Tax=Linum trigynum TaxID=586398 RepID=A0AAV2ERR3_9ROSI
MDAEKILAHVVIEINDGGNDSSYPSIDFGKVGVGLEQASQGGALPETPRFDSGGASGSEFLRSSFDRMAFQREGDEGLKDVYSEEDHRDDKG